MAVTNYYSLDDGMIGEETGGTRRDYLTDALGSVTATVTSAGAIENTYRYKPYGETLAKTGVGSDPKFLWVGKWGYRAGSSSGSFYVRARTYFVLAGRWTSLDPIQSGYNWYGYCENDSVNAVDPKGLEIFLGRKDGKGNPVSQKDRVEYNRAMKYILSDTEVARINKDIGKWEVIIVHDGNNFTDTTNHTINWDPNSGNDNLEGGIQSPALGLVHEIGHAYEEDAQIGPQTDLPGGPILGDILLALFDNWGDLRVILGIESDFARRHGEPVRNTHHTKPKKVPNSTWHTRV